MNTVNIVFLFLLLHLPFFFFLSFGYFLLQVVTCKNRTTKKVHAWGLSVLCWCNMTSSYRWPIPYVVRAYSKFMKRQWFIDKGNYTIMKRYVCIPQVYLLIDILKILHSGPIRFYSVSALKWFQFCSKPWWINQIFFLVWNMLLFINIWSLFCPICSSNGIWVWRFCLVLVILFCLAFLAYDFQQLISYFTHTIQFPFYDLATAAFLFPLAFPKKCDIVVTVILVQCSCLFFWLALELFCN